MAVGEQVLGKCQDVVETLKHVMPKLSIIDSLANLFSLLCEIVRVGFEYRMVLLTYMTLGWRWGRCARCWFEGVQVGAGEINKVIDGYGSSVHFKGLLQSRIS